MRVQSVALAALVCCLGCGPSDPPRAAPVPDEVIPISTTSEKAKTLFIKGRDAVYSRNEKVALEALQEAVSLDPNFALAHLYLARAYDNLFDPRGQQEISAAIQAAEVAKVSPGERYLIQAYDHGRNNETEPQRSELLRLAGLYPADKYAIYELGRYYDDFGVRRLKTAAEKYEEVISLDPNFAPVYNSLAYVYADIGDFTKATERVRKYAELDKDNPNAQDSAGEILLWAGDYQEAIAAYGRALQKDENFFYSYLGQGHALSFSGEAAKARETYAKAKGASSDSEKIQPAYWSAVSFLHEGKPAEAQAALTSLLVEADKQPAISWGARIRLDLAWIALYNKAPDLAFSAVSDAERWLAGSKVSEAEKSNLIREAQVVEGLISIAKADFDTARATLAKLDGATSTRRNPREEEYSNTLRAALALAQNDLPGAQAALAKAGDTNPYSFDLALRLATAKADAKGVEAARARILSWNRNSLGYALVLYPLRSGTGLPASGPASAPLPAPLPAPGGGAVLPTPAAPTIPVTPPPLAPLPPG